MDQKNVTAFRRERAHQRATKKTSRRRKTSEGPGKRNVRNVTVSGNASGGFCSHCKPSLASSRLRRQQAMLAAKDRN